MWRSEGKIQDIASRCAWWMDVHVVAYQVVPPAEWKPRCGGYDDIGSMEISTPISQFVNGQQGVYQLYNIQKKPITVTEYIEMANSDRLVGLDGSLVQTLIY